jgi:hypothetical protein
LQAAGQAESALLPVVVARLKVQRCLLSLQQRCGMFSCPDRTQNVTAPLCAVLWSAVMFHVDLLYCMLPCCLDAMQVFISGTDEHLELCKATYELAQELKMQCDGQPALVRHPF